MDGRAGWQIDISGNIGRGGVSIMGMAARMNARGRRMDRGRYIYEQTSPPLSTYHLSLQPARHAPPSSSSPHRASLPPSRAATRIKYLAGWNATCYTRAPRCAFATKERYLLQQRSRAHTCNSGMNGTFRAATYGAAARAVWPHRQTNLTIEL